jgi:hypothetical protein
MWPTNPTKTILVIFISLLCCLTAVQAQQAPPASASPAVPAGVPVGSSAPSASESSKQTTAGPETRKGEDSVPVATNPPQEVSDKPSIPRAQTVIVKEGQKIPERADPGYEDWSKPDLTPGMRSESQVLDRGADKGFTKELVYVQWREMDPIDLHVIKPAGVEKPPVILYLYSYPSSNERYKDPEFCRFLTRNGFAAVGFVSALTEHRFHDRPRKDWFVSQFQESLGTSVHDVQMVLNYLATRGDLDMTRVGMWGDGSGASIAIMAAAVDSRIKVLDLLDPWGDWPGWLAKSTLVPETQRANYLKLEFLKTVENLDPIKLLPQLKTQQVRLQSITDGITVTPASVRDRIEAAAPSNVKIVHYQSVKAFATEVGATGKGFDWIKEQLDMPFPARVGGTESMTKASAQSKNSDR